MKRVLALRVSCVSGWTLLRCGDIGRRGYVVCAVACLPDLSVPVVGNWTYTHTIRRPEINKESPELKMQISSREYEVSYSSCSMLHTYFLHSQHSLKTERARIDRVNTYMHYKFNCWLLICKLHIFPPLSLQTIRTDYVACALNEHCRLSYFNRK